MQIYETIKNLCERNETTITKLCVDVTGNKGNLATWKTGSIRNDYLIKIAQYFNVSTDYLLGLIDNPIPVSSEVSPPMFAADEIELLTNYNLLNPEGQEVLRNTAKGLSASGQYKKSNTVGLG